MANATDFIASVYDLLAKTFNFNNAPGKTFLQMAWPGIPIVAEDFKDATGKYDRHLAEEAFSALANVAPAFNKMNYENSGFEIDDLYEIMIASARPSGIPAAELQANPLYKLFSDAQFEFFNSKKGSIRDPNVFYYPYKATPSNWYEEPASTFWTSVEIKSTEVKPATKDSFFIKNKGEALIAKGVWKVKTKTASDADIKAGLLQHLQLNKTSLVKTFPLTNSTATPNVLNSYADKIITTNKAPFKINTPQAVLSNDFKLNFSKAILSNNKKLVPANTFDKNAGLLNSIKSSQINKEKMLVIPRSMNVKQSLFVNKLLMQGLATRPASATTTGYSISFRFCRVNIDCDWMKLALLSNPNWYMVGYPAGEYSNNSTDNNPGMFPMVPVSFIVVSGLKITANWSTEDKNTIQNAASFGPFDIRNGTLNQNTLEIKGMQVIAWFSKVTPVLAPVASP